jgi:excisionase family DNA binding protein
VLTTRELADYLRLNERTVLKLAADGAIPGVRLGNQWRFKQTVIDAWLDDQMLGLHAVPAEPPPDLLATFTLEDAFAESHILLRLKGRSVPAALGELAGHAAELGLIRDRTWFLGALLERENVLSSAVGNGVAFPHTMRRHPEQVRRPFLLLGRSPDGIDFGAPDGEPVRLVLLMGLRYEQLHLPWLARLSRLLRDPQVRATLLGARAPRALFASLRACVERTPDQV